MPLHGCVYGCGIDVMFRVVPCESPVRLIQLKHIGQVEENLTKKCYEGYSEKFALNDITTLRLAFIQSLRSKRAVDRGGHRSVLL